MGEIVGARPAGASAHLRDGGVMVTLPRSQVFDAFRSVEPVSSGDVSQTAAAQTGALG
jgi:hypothetical protein